MTQSGPVQASVKVEPDEILIGDPIDMTLQVTAEQDVELLMPEFGQMLGRYQILDYSVEEDVDDEGRTVIIQQYRLQTYRSGEQTIAPLLIEFVDHRPGMKPAPDGMDAYELLTERINFNVKSVLPDDAKADLNPPIGELPLIESDKSSRSYWLGLFLAVMVIVAIPIVRYWNRCRLRARKRSAYEIALRRLNDLLGRSCSTPEEVDRFFVELSAIVRHYLEDRFSLRAPELTTEEFLTLLSRSPDTTGEHQVLLRDFLRRADLVKFARFMPSSQDIDDSVSAARRFLEETRRQDDQDGDADRHSQRIKDVACV